MKNFKLFEKLWEHSRTLRRVGMVLVMCLITITQVWADDGNFYDVTIIYDYDGSEHEYTFHHTDNNSSFNISLGTITSDFYIKKVWFKFWDDYGALHKWDNGQIEYAFNSDWSDKSYMGKDYFSTSDRYNTNNYNLYNENAQWYFKRLTDGSNNYTLRFYFHAWNGSVSGRDKYVNNSGNNYKFTFTIAPPDVSDYTVTPTGAIGGSGTASDPYIVPYGGNLQLDLSGASKAHTDANSSIQYSIDNSSWGTATANTRKIIENVTSTSVQNWVVYAKYYNSTAGLSGAVNGKTIYYRAMKVHEPGTYEKATGSGGYGKTLKTYDGKKYELYYFSQSSSKGILYAGESSPFTVFNNANAGEQKISSDAWVVSSARAYENNGSTNKYEMSNGGSSISTHAAKLATGGNYVKVYVSGYDQFTFFGRDQHASTAGKKFLVKIDGETQSFTHQTTDHTPYRFDISSGAHMIEIYGTGSTSSDDNYLRAFSLRLAEYTISYNKGSASGAAGSLASGTKYHNTNFTLSSVDDAFTRTGYTYDGWSVNEDGSTKDYEFGATYSTNAALTLYPHWAEVACGATAPGTITKGTLSGCTLTLTAGGSAASNNTWYWQSSSTGTATNLGTGATKDVTAPGTYYIRSFYSTGSCWSDAESYTVTASDLTPAAPTALAKSSETAKGVTLTVTDAANTNDYEFYVSTADDEPGAGTSATHSVTDAKSLTITNLVAGTTYYAWARAKCGSNKSDWIALGSGGTFTTSTVSADYHLTNVTKTTGATSGIGGSEFEAVFAAVSGYSMPNPTVTIDGNSATSGTDYTWNAGTGTLTINANKINGNIDITLNSAAAAPSSVAISGGLLYFAGETISLTATPTGGNGPVTYQWYKGGTADGNAIEGATNATYTKASCAFEDAGSYYCKVTCGGSQSTWGQSGNAYDVKIPRLYVKTGHFYDPVKIDYGNVDFTRAAVSTATASIVLGSNGEYCFNINDGCGHYYGNTGTMQYNNYGPWTTNVIDTLCGLTTTNAGTYIFTINYSTWSQLTTTVTFPSCTDPGLAFASASKSVTLCDDAPTNALTNTHGVTVSYASSNTSVAEVASDGTITLVGAGETTITASADEQTISTTTYCEDNASYTITVTASTAAGLSYGTTTVNKDDNAADFTNTLTNTNSLTGITYTSSNTDVATVNSTTGLVDVKAAGTTTITASSEQQKITSTCYAAGEVSYTLNVAQSYTVEYNAMSGSCATESVTASSVTLPEATRSGYTLEGWYKTDGTKVGVAGGTYNPTADITLYAKWAGSCAGGGGSETIISVTISSNADNTSGTSASGTIGGTAYWKDLNGSGPYKLNADNSSYVALRLATGYFASTDQLVITGADKHHYVYTGTHGSGSPLGVTDGPSDGVITYTLTDIPANTSEIYVYRPSSKTTYNGTLTSMSVTRGGSSCYQVTYNGNGASGGYVSDPAQYENGTTVYVYDAVGSYTRTGYEFNGWNTKADGSGTKLSYFTITRDTTLYAQWRIVISSDNTNFEGKDTPTAYKDVKVTNGATLTITNATTMRDVTVTNGATLKIQKGTTVHDITVETGSTLNIAKDGESGVTLAANSLALKGGWDDNKTKYDMPRVYIDPASKITREEKDINFDIAVDNNNFYPIAVPFDVSMSDVTYKNSVLAASAASRYGTVYAVKTYNGANRANGTSPTWSLVGKDKTLKPGHGYVLCAVPAVVWGEETAVIKFPMKNVPDAALAAGELGSYSTTIKDTVNLTAYWKDGDTDGSKTSPSNTGWNLISVPYMSCYTTSTDMTSGSYVEDPATIISGRINFDNGKWISDGIQYVTVPKYDFSEYTQAKITDDDTITTLLPGWCFFVQVAQTGNLRFLSASEAESGSWPIYAPKREQEDMPTYKTGIILTGNGAKDKTNFLISDKYNAAEYEINADLEKMFGENSYTLATYSLSGSIRLAYNALSNAEAANIIPIGYRAPADGDYTFSINPRYADGSAFEHVNLIDYETGIVTDLLMSSYTFTTERTQNDARFALNVVPRQEMPTDIENGASDASDIRKMIINDQLYIILNGKMYDATGKAVK